MFFLAWALLLLVLTLVGLVRTARNFVTFTRVRRTGIRVNGAVVGHEARRRYYRNGYWLIPIVRYEVDGRTYEQSVANLGDRTEEGTGMDLIVDPDVPWRPWSEYFGTSGRAFVQACAFTVFAALFVLWAGSSL